MPGKKQNISQLVLTQHIFAKTSHASEDRKYIYTWVNHTQPMSAWAQNILEPVLTKSMPARTQNVSQHVFNKPLK